MNISNLRETTLESEVARSYAQPVSFGKNVKRLRKELGLKAKDLAKQLGVEGGTLSDWERDRRGLPEGPTLIKFAKTLQCSVDDLLGGFDEQYDELYRRIVSSRIQAWNETIDPVRHIDHGSSGAAQSQPQQGGPSNVTAPPASSRLLAEELGHLADLADDLKGAIQDVADRLVGDVAPATDADATGTHRRQPAGGVRRPRKAG